MFFPSRARLASCRLLMHRRRNLANSAVPTLLSRGSRLAFSTTMCRAECDLEACWNRILTIFNPYTFSHSQGQKRSCSRRPNNLDPCPQFLRFPMYLRARTLLVGHRQRFSQIERGCYRSQSRPLCRTAGFPTTVAVRLGCTRWKPYARSLGLGYMPRAGLYGRAPIAPVQILWPEQRKPFIGALGTRA